MGNDLITNDTNAFDEVISIIENARENAFRAVNRELIGMYWDIGEYVSRRVADGGWGKAVVKEFSDFIQSRYVGIKGFSPQNIWRMKQFFETYNGNEKLSALLREISWTNNLQILSGKTVEEREFYITLTLKNRYSSRELKRQMDSALYERTMLSEITNTLITERNEGLTALRDSYVLEFLDLPESHREKDLRKAIVRNLKDFVLEFGKDFAFVGEEYRVQVGNRDFFVDLLFSNRELRCLVAIELKIGEFEPEHFGKMEFYLEALDRDVKKYPKILASVLYFAQKRIRRWLNTHSRAVYHRQWSRITNCICQTSKYSKTNYESWQTLQKTPQQAKIKGGNCRGLELYQRAIHRGRT